MRMTVPTSKSYYVDVPCGKCLYCLNTRRNEWSFRIFQELKHARSAWFITLTYDDHNIPLSNYYVQTLVKKDLQDWLKKVTMRHNRHEQKMLRNPKSCPVRYYAVGEYGTRTERPHYHAIIFNIDKAIIAKCLDSWKHGFFQMGDVNSASIRYTTKYVINKKAEDQGHISKELREPGFAIMSTRPPIGFQYNEAMNYHRSTWNLTVKNENGVMQPLPRIYRNKFFSQDELEYLKDELIQMSDEKSIERYNNLIDRDQEPSLYEEQIHQVKVSQFNKRNRKNTF